MALVCKNSVIEGTQMAALIFSSHAIERLQKSKISMFLIFRLLREGKFSVVTKIYNGIWVIRSGQIDLIVDSLNCLVKTVIVTAFKRIYVRPAKISDIVDEPTKKKLRMIINNSVRHRYDYLEEYLELNNIKKMN